MYKRQEEMQGVFDAKGVDPSKMPGHPEDDFMNATGAGRGFAVTGGVAAAVKAAIHEIEPDREVNVEHADGLRECRKMLMIAKTGKYNGYLLEGMGCPGGCVAGAGTIAPVKKSSAGVAKYKATAQSQNAVESKITNRLQEVEES